VRRWFGRYGVGTVEVRTRPRQTYVQTIGCCSDGPITYYESAISWRNARFVGVGARGRNVWSIPTRQRLGCELTPLHYKRLRRGVLAASELRYMKSRLSGERS